jgi:hypothetical protein
LPALQDYITKLVKGELGAMVASDADLAKVKPLKKRGKQQQQGQGQGHQQQAGVGAEDQGEGVEAEVDEAGAAHHVLSEAARNSKDAPVGNADLEVPGNDVAEVSQEGTAELEAAAAAAAAAAAGSGRGKCKKRGSADAAPGQQQQAGAAAEHQPAKKGRKR